MKRLKLRLQQGCQIESIGLIEQENVARCFSNNKEGDRWENYNWKKKPNC